jgi:hypothetical protein
MANSQSGPLNRLVSRHHAFHFGASLHRAPDVPGPTDGIERVGPMDQTVLASDHGTVPMNIGAVLEFDERAVPSMATMRDLLEARVPGVTRLRQTLSARAKSTATNVTCTRNSAGGNKMARIGSRDPVVNAAAAHRPLR